MKVMIKRFDKDLPLPEYKTAGAVAMDLVARTTVTIQPGQPGYVPLNIALQLPLGTWAMLAARSSLHKRGLILANGIGIGDEDFCGDADEYQAALWNLSEQAVTIERGERICQLMIREYERVEWEETEVLGGNNRGGLGSTGLK